MHRRHLLLSAIGLSLCARPALADTPLSLVPEAQKVGSGRLSYLFMPIFDATLYGPQGRWDANQPFALRLDYLRPLKGKAIAKNSVEEMRKQGAPDASLKIWGAQLEAIIPDVGHGVSITGVRDAAGATGFYSGDKWLGGISAPEFSTCFFAIWLGEKTSQPALRKQLLGQYA